MDDWIGLRVARYRDLAGLTQQQLADRVGKSRPYVSQIENGARTVTTRALLIAFAEALGVATTDLTGSPRPTRDPAERAVHVAVPAIRAALDGALDPVTVAHDRLYGDALTLARLRMACDYTMLGPMLAPTLAGAQALVDADGDPANEELLTRVLVTISLVVRPLGYLDFATRLADRAVISAQRCNLPDAIGAAAFARAQCSLAGGVQGLRRVSLRDSERAADGLQDWLDDGPTSMWYGMLHLHAGLSAATLGNDQLAMGHIAEAADIARRTPAPLGDAWFMDFSAANVGVWKVAATLEGPSPDLAPDVASDVAVRSLATTQRRAHLLTHTAHGHFMRGEYDTATGLFLQADRIAPTEVRGRSKVREVVGQMLRDARRSAGSQGLRDLAIRVGVDPLIE